MNTFLQGLFGIIGISIVPAIGFLFIVTKRDSLEKYTHILISFAIGALLGNAFLHLIPEAFEMSENQKIASLSIIIGILLFYSVEQFFHWHHSHQETSLQHHSPVGAMNIVGDAIHNFLDGAVIASSFLISPYLGWITVLAVLIHEIPHEAADLSIFIHSQWPIKKIFIAYLFSALAAFVGYLISFTIANSIQYVEPYALAITAGGFIYIACSDLIPDLHHHGAERLSQRFVQLGAIALGIFLFVLL